MSCTHDLRFIPSVRHQSFLTIDQNSLFLQLLLEPVKASHFSLLASYSLRIIFFMILYLIDKSLERVHINWIKYQVSSTNNIEVICFDCSISELSQ